MPDSYFNSSTRLYEFILLDSQSPQPKPASRSLYRPRSLTGYGLSDERTLGTEIANIGNSMRQWVADQLHAEAGSRFDIRLQMIGKYKEAMKYFQIAASTGSSVTAISLSSAFSNKNMQSRLGALDKQQIYNTKTEMGRFRAS